MGLLMVYQQVYVEAWEALLPVPPQMQTSLTGTGRQKNMYIKPKTKTEKKTQNEGVGTGHPSWEKRW